MGKGRGGKLSRKGILPLPQRYEGELLEIECRYKREEAFLAERAKIFARKTGRRRDPRTPLGKRPPASREVWNTAELLEGILQHLDMKTILVSASRVNTTWYLAIYNSPLLQEKLFIKPIPTVGGVKPPGVTLEGDTGRFEGRVFNPILVEKFGPVFFDFGPNAAQFRRPEAFYTMPWCAMPHEIHTYRGKDAAYGRPRIQPPRYGGYELGVKGRADALEARQRFLRRGASWRRMLLTQPPPPKLGFLLYSHDEPRSVKSKVKGVKQVQQYEFVVCSRPWRVVTKFGVSTNPVTNGDGEKRPEPEEDTPEGRINGARMGKVYDVVSVVGGQSFKQGRFWRILWKRPETAAMSDSLSKVRDRYLDSVGFVIEMHDDDFPEHKVYGPEPTDKDVFNKTFLCEDTWWEKMPAPHVTKSLAIVMGGKGDGLDRACHNAILSSSYPWQGDVILLPQNKMSPFDNVVFADRLKQTGRLFRQSDNREDKAEKPWLTDLK